MAFSPSANAQIFVNYCKINVTILFVAHSIWDRLPPPTVKKVPGSAAVPIPGELSYCL
jgi:hypothetical protein